MTQRQDDPTTSASAMARRAIENHLWSAIDLMAATLEKPDPRIWGHLLVYMPKADADGEEVTEKERS